MKFRKVQLLAVAVLALPLFLLPGSAISAVRYVDDGAVQNAQGGFSLPAQGTCPAGAAQGYTGIDTRPECVALRLNPAGISGGCVAPNYSSTTSGVCNYLGVADETACNAKLDSLWNPSTGICSVVMSGDDRNNVTCALHGASWVTTATCVGVWIMPARTDYTPNLLTGNGTGDQCLRCHNDKTQYNGPRVRDTEETMFMGHKNMARKVTVGTPWGGPPFTCSNPLYTNEEACEDNGGQWNPTIYPSDDGGNLINWVTGQITVSGTPRDMAWIYGDWLAELPRVIYKAPAASTANTCTNALISSQCVSGVVPNQASVSTLTTQAACEANGNTWYAGTSTVGIAAACTANGGTMVNGAGASYSCGRCHTTGWTPDATVPAAQTDTRLTKEPERSFSGITWPRTSIAGPNVVNLTGGVYQDSSKSSSWDVWGISCARCHNSAIETTTITSAGPPIQYGSPAGMSSHHNNLTSPTSAMCSDPRWTALAQCQSAGGTWMLTSGTSGCSVAGVCVDPVTGLLDPTKNTALTCTGGTLQWAAASDIVRCEDIAEYGKLNNISAYAAARFTGTQPQRGQTITSLCMDCHRQETQGKPYQDTAAYLLPSTDGSSHPGQYLKVGPAHGTVASVSHPAGNEYLNSPHAKFDGTFAQIATGTFNFAGTGQYKSFFMTDGEAANTGNGCTGCHDVHTSTVTGNSLGGEKSAFREECTACHSKNLNRLQHPQGGTTPIALPRTAEGDFEACVKCHMPEGTHLWRINVDPAYSRFPSAALTATVNANTTPDGAIWNDLDHACGQCHGGGTAQASTTGSVTVIAGNTNSAKTLTVTNATGFAIGEKIRIADAGALYYDEVPGVAVRGDFDSYIAGISGTTITLAGGVSATVANVAVVQNATTNGGGYINKTNLALLAAGIHNDTATASFGYQYGTPQNVVNFDARGSVCANGPCDRYEWDFDGDGTYDLTVDAVPPAVTPVTTASKTYLSAGTYNVKLRVTEFGSQPGTKTVPITVAMPNNPPTVAATPAFPAAATPTPPCGPSIFNSNTWVATFTEASSDVEGPLKQVTVNWGDGSMLVSDTTAPFNSMYTRTYQNVKTGGYTITHQAIDQIGQSSTEVCTVTPALFTISGTVKTGAAANIPYAKVEVKKGATFLTSTLVGTVYTSSTGAYSIGSLKPLPTGQSYFVIVSKTGYTFLTSPATVTVGPSSTTNFTSTP